MAQIVNERDVLIRSAPARVIDYDLPSNVQVPALKGLSLTSPGAIFRVANNGDISPTGISLTVNLRGLPEDTPITWSVTFGQLSAPITTTGLTYTLQADSMVTEVVTIEASVVSAGFTYRDGVTFARIQDGSLGLPGSRGSLTAARAVTGSSWSDAEAVQALRDYGLPEPVAAIAGDLVTLYNTASRFVQMRRFDGDSWEVEAPSFPGTAIMPGTVATEQLLVTGMAEALNSDPNTVDLTAWTGNGISIVSDASAPNGISALRCTGQGVTVLSRRFPVNEIDNYQLRLWAKQQSGSSNAYLLVAFYDANQALIQGTVSPSGWPSAGTHHYFGLVNQDMPPAWTQYSVDFGQDETRKVPAGARFAAVGIISNFLSAGEQRLTGVVCKRKVDGRVVVEGSLAARHIDTRGLTVRNGLGAVMLDATGDAVPPWVVSLDNRPEPGALQLASPKDDANRAALRSLKVDQVALKAQFSSSGAAIELSSSATEVWRVGYSGSLTILPGDGEVDLEYSSLQMQPGTTYEIELRVVCNASTTTEASLRLRLQVPAGCNVALQDGTVISSTTAGPITLFTPSAPTNTANALAPQTYKLLITAGPDGGQIRLRALAQTAGVRIQRGTQFIANRLSTFVQPAVLAQPTGTLVPPFTSNVISPAAVTTPAGQTYNAYVELDAALPVSTTATLFFGLDIEAVALVRRSGVSAGALYAALRVVDYGSRSNVTRLTTFNLSETRTSNVAGTTTTSTFRTAAIVCEILAPAPVSEDQRWTLEHSWQVVQAVPSNDIDPGYMTGSGSCPVGDVLMDVPLAYTPFYDAVYSSLSKAVGGSGLQYATISRVPGYVIVDFTFQLAFAGIKQGSPYKLRLRINRA